jgi:MFS family permease
MQDGGSIIVVPQVEPVLDQAPRKRTMRLSILEGSASQTSFSISDNFVNSPLAIAMGCTDFQIGLLTSLGGLLDPVGQLMGSRIIKHSRRKKLLVYGVLAQALFWPLYIFLIGAKGASGAGEVALISWSLVAVFGAYKLVGGLSNPPWFSMMGDIVPPVVRGKYFAFRNLVVTAVSMSIIVLIGFLLQGTAQAQILIIFAWIMVIAFSGRMISFASLTKHYDPPFRFLRESEVSFRQFLRSIRGTNFGKFTIMVVVVNFGQYIASPFFSVYMLQALHFTYATYIVVSMAPSLFSLFVYPLLGKISDKRGNVRLLRIGACIVPFLPLAWLFLSNPIGLIVLPQLGSGIGWTAFNLGASNFIFDSVEPQKRAEYVAHYNLLNGVAIVLGGIVGSIFFAINLGSIVMPFFVVFCVSAIVRVIAVAFLVPRIKEVHRVRSN